MASVLIRGLRMGFHRLDGRLATISIRPYSTDSTKDSKVSKYSPEALKKDVRGYVFTRYVDHVKNYDKGLQKNFPSALRVYRVFVDGVAAFYQDMKRYIKITRIINGSAQGLAALTRGELELYLQMRLDMYKVAPVILFSSLPFVGYAALPLAALYPRALLSSHFWTLQQKAEFQQYYLIQRLSNNRNVLRSLQSKLEEAKCLKYYEVWNHIIVLLGSGQHPSPNEILSIKDLFAESPYQFSSLTQKHIKYLCNIHGIRAGLFAIFGREKLRERADLLHHMDLAIRREGGVHNMHPDALKKACYIRGLNPINMSSDGMIEWLQGWVEVSLDLEEQHNSLLLHLPILLGYNHPNNWQLIYKKH